MGRICRIEVYYYNLPNPGPAEHRGVRGLQGQIVRKTKWGMGWLEKPHLKILLEAAIQNDFGLLAVEPTTCQ